MHVCHQLKVGIHLTHSYKALFMYFKLNMTTTMLHRQEGANSWNLIDALRLQYEALARRSRYQFTLTSTMLKSNNTNPKSNCMPNLAR